MTLAAAFTYILLLGDINFTGSHYLTEMAKAGYDPAFSFRDSAATIRAADFAIANLEGPLSLAEWSPDSADKRWRFRQLPAFADGLKSAGIDIVLLGNNHIADAGQEGIDDTIKLLDAAGIQHVPPPADGPLLVQHDTARIEIWNADIFSAAGSHPWAISGPNLVKTVKLWHAEQAAQLSIVVIHDHEHDPLTGQDRQQLSADLRSAGIQWVIFGGDHVAGELRANPTGGVHEGLGDFIFGCECSGALQGKALQLELRDSSVVAHDLPVSTGNASNAYRAVIRATNQQQTR